MNFRFSTKLKYFIFRIGNRDFIEFIFESFKSNYCYFVISNSNRYLLNKLSKSYLGKIEKRFKKTIYSLITRHVKKFKLKTQENEISSLVIYFFYDNNFL